LDTCIRIIDFDGANMGKYPGTKIIEANNGKLYGVAQRGGVNDEGTLYEFDLATQTFTKKIDFAGLSN